MSVRNFPPLLSTADAMMWAAETLDVLMRDFELLVVLKQHNIVDTMNEKSMDPKDKERVRSLRESLENVVDPDLQRRAMSSAAAEIRRHAIAMKLGEAARIVDGE